MFSCALLLAPFLALYTQTTALGNNPKGLHYIGVGYNLLEGNPEGGQVSSGGVDPGLLFTRKVFKLTWNTNKVSMDKTTSLPDQVSFAPRQSCVKTNQKEVVTGSKSYQEKLNVDVQASGGYNGGPLFQVAFSLSSRFEKMQKETSKYHNVFYEEKHVCNRGRARYQLDLAAVKGYPVSHDFASAVCSLPESYDDKKYYDFIENWGTHIVVEADLGTRTIERFKSSKAEFTKYAMENADSSVSVSGSYMGYSASLQVDVKKFKEAMSDKTKFGENKLVLTSGGDNMPEPIAIKLVPIDVGLRDAFYSSLNAFSITEDGCSFTSSVLSSKRANVQKALVDYPKKKGAIKPVDPEVRIPLSWPKGTYGIPMPTSGCPAVEGFAWHEGTRYQDTQNIRGKNAWSNPSHLAGTKTKTGMEQKFCMKTQLAANKYDLAWPKGKYCIFKKGACPEGLNAGYIKWDDEDMRNRNSHKGALPDGTYDRNTLIQYCCRTDGYPTNEIILPADKPFIMFKSNSHQCQKVRGMRSTTEWFFWDCEDFAPKNRAGGYRPFASVGRNIRVDYCYYTPETPQ